MTFLEDILIYCSYHIDIRGSVLTVMAARFLISIDLESIGTSSQGKGVEWKTISYLGHVYATVTPSSIEKATSLLDTHFHECKFYFDVTALKNIQDILKLLDGGAVQVFVQPSQFKSIVEGNLLEDLGRLVVLFDNASGVRNATDEASRLKQEVEAVLGEAKSGLSFSRGIESKVLDSLSSDPEIKKFAPRYVLLDQNFQEDYARSIGLGFIPVVPASALTFEPEIRRNQIPVEELITAALSTDRSDGLYTTVVQNDRGDCLGLVYSNNASIEASLQRGVGVYKSRKREGLWVKGETSGDTQELVRIGWDCDGDALLFTVRQKGDGMQVDAS